MAPDKPCPCAQDPEPCEDCREERERETWEAENGWQDDYEHWRQHAPGNQ